MSEQQIDEHVEIIRRDGYALVEGEFDAGFADAATADLERIERDRGIAPADNSFEGQTTVRIYHRDEQPQPIHADDQLIPIPKPHVPIVCNSMWAVTDFTEENGATRIVPRSHLFDHSPQYGKEYDSVPALMKRGDVLVYHGSLWHGGGANRTPERRIRNAMNYCAGFMRQQENQQLGIPRDVAARFSPRLQQLVGYDLYNGLIGPIDKTHPVELLGRHPDGALVWDLADGK